MSSETLIKFFFALIFSGVFAWVIFDRDATEQLENGDRQRYLPYIPGSLLPGFMLCLFLLGAVNYGPVRAGALLFNTFFPVVLHICAYNVLLLALLPLLRRWFSARACAVLWMLPNYLYVALQDFAWPAMPALVLRAPGKLLRYLLAVWLAGFLAVMGWKCIAHLVFRRRLLDESAPVRDPAVLAVWEAELADARFKKPKFKLMVSPAVTTPLSIGLTQRSTRVVLPRRDYTEAELHLLLRHELIHISRGDAANKFFMVFCTALCWFNPLMWIAMGKSADDLELSCDETVLLDCDRAEKQRYASLLLNTAGDGRGFTSCLSASAESLRYRLKNAVEPKKKRCGALLVGLAFFLLFMSCGYVALAYDGGSGGELLFRGAPETCSVMNQTAFIRTDSNSTQFRDATVRDEAALMDYLAALELYRLTGGYSGQTPEGQWNYYSFTFATPAGVEIVTLCGNTVRLVPLHGERPQPQTYYVPDGIDGAYLESLLS